MSKPPPTSGANIEELPLPPPDFTPVTTEEWSKQRMPPMRGVIIDPEYPPTEAEARKTLGLNQDGTRTAQSQSHSRDGEPATGAAAPSGPKPFTPFNPRRSSGTSQILGTAPSANEIVNEMPGGTAHTAGGEKLVDVGVAEALRTIRPHDFLHVHKMPCFRDSYLYGMGGGFLVGGGMWIVGKPLRKIPNYVFGTTIGIAMVAYAWCHSERQREKRGMRMVVDVMEQKQMEKKGKLDEFMEKKRVADEARRADEGKTEDKKKGWWRYWEGREGKDITYGGREG